jgi:predicted GNAT superfamily acetyltransferase
MADHPGEMVAARVQRVKSANLRQVYDRGPQFRDAFLNIHKLGAIVRRYEENFYGVSSSRLQGGLQTDRLVAEWWIVSDRVAAAIRGESPTSPKRRSESSENWVTSIEVPAEIYAWKADERHRHLAQEVQAENRAKFQEAFSQGLAVVAFTRDGEGNGTFHLGQWNEPQSESSSGFRSESSLDESLRPQEPCVKLG